jgi:hypothetical protein
MSLAGWYVSFVFHVFPVTVQEIVQCPLLTHVKDSVVTVPTGTPLLPARDSHVFLHAPYMDSSLQIQPSFSLATISLVFRSGSRFPKKCSTFSLTVTHFQIFTFHLLHFFVSVLLQVSSLYNLLPEFIPDSVKTLRKIYNPTSYGSCS